MELWAAAQITDLWLFLCRIFGHRLRYLRNDARSVTYRCQFCGFTSQRAVWLLFRQWLRSREAGRMRL